MVSNYHYSIPFKTKILNVPRRLFKLRIFEQLLARNITENSSFLKKLVPPEYLYPNGSWRTITKNSSTLQLDISNVVDHEIYFNLFETTFARFIQGLSDLKMFWDIGANIGWTVLQVKEHFPNAQIFAFEPSPKNRERLENHIVANKVSAEIVPFGLGNETKSFKLYSVLENNPGMNRILEKAEINLPFENISVITGSSFWEKIGKPQVDALKIDVEGFEMNVLLGMEAVIETCRPQMFLEVDEKNLAANGYNAKQLLKWLSDKGYKLAYADSKEQIDISSLHLPDHFDVTACQ